MVTISKPLSAGQAQAYHKEEFTNARENYYTQGDQIHGEWQGQLAERWGSARNLPRFGPIQLQVLWRGRKCGKQSRSTWGFARLLTCYDLNRAEPSPPYQNINWEKDNVSVTTVGRSATQRNGRLTDGDRHHAMPHPFIIFACSSPKEALRAVSVEEDFNLRVAAGCGGVHQGGYLADVALYDAPLRVAKHNNGNGAAF